MGLVRTDQMDIVEIISKPKMHIKAEMGKNIFSRYVSKDSMDQSIDHHI
jgi:hypothetical protein